MSSINSISNQTALAYSVSCNKSEELSTTTKMKLEALGIDPSSVTSEAQAQVLITQAEAAQKESNSGKEGGNSSQQELISEAKTLAAEVGAAVSNQDSLENILNKISDKIGTMGKDPSNAQRVQKFQSELTSLAQRADVIISTQQNIFNTMDMISVSNKLILGL